MTDVSTYGRRFINAYHANYHETPISTDYATYHVVLPWVTRGSRLGKLFNFTVETGVFEYLMATNLHITFLLLFHGLDGTPHEKAEPQILLNLHFACLHNPDNLLHCIAHLLWP